MAFNIRIGQRKATVPTIREWLQRPKVVYGPQQVPPIITLPLVGGYNLNNPVARPQFPPPVYIQGPPPQVISIGTTPTEAE